MFRAIIMVDLDINVIQELLPEHKGLKDNPTSLWLSCSVHSFGHNTHL